MVQEEASRVDEASRIVGEDGGAEDVGQAEHQVGQNQIWMQENRRTDFLEVALKEGKWMLKRCGKHVVYTRQVIVMTHGIRKTLESQTFTTSKTPSDLRAHANALAQLRRYDDGVIHVCSNSAGASASAELAEVTDRIRDTQRELEANKQRLSTSEREVDRLKLELAQYESQRHLLEWGGAWQ